MSGLQPPITASKINVELGRSANAHFSMNDTEVRALAEKPSGVIKFSDFIGKSWVKIDTTIRDFSASDADEYTATATIRFINGRLERLDGIGSVNATVVLNNISAAQYKIVTTSGTLPNGVANNLLREMTDTTTMSFTAKFNENNSASWAGKLHIYVNNSLKHTVNLRLSASADGTGEPDL